MQLSVRDAAGYLRVSEDTIYRWIEENAIPFTRIDDQYRLNSSELLEWAAVRGVQVSVAILSHAQGEVRGPSFAEALRAGNVHRLADARTREAVLTALVGQLPLPDEGEREVLLSMVRAREALGSTGVGGGIAIPHLRAPVVVHGTPASISVWYLALPVDFQAADGKPVDTVFFLVTPSPRTHLQLLSRLSAALHDAAFRAALASRAELPQLLLEAARIEASFPASQDTGVK